MASGDGSGALQHSALSEEIQSFFNSAPPLRNSSEIEEKLQGFIERHSTLLENGKATRVACVTSGGTTVPLEQRCVRYIDNFSLGHRGAASTEYLIKAGYAVIFLYRRGTCQPYCRSLPDDPFLECFECSDDSQIRVREPHAEAAKRAISGHHSAVEKGLLLKLPFTTIFEYLQMLQMISTSLCCLGPRVMYYLAAAGSLIFMFLGKAWYMLDINSKPRRGWQAEHKIQSGSGPLDMRLVQVPKMLAVLRKVWDPSAFCVSFKLETDTKILLDKADTALKKYGMHAVVANELVTRKEEVVVVTSNQKVSVRRDKADPSSDVEEPLIKLLVDKHHAHILHCVISE